MTRLDHYLKKLMDNEGKYIRINLLKSHNKWNSREERRKLFKEIKSALTLLGVRYELGETYKIKILTQKEIEMRDELSKLFRTYGVTGRQSGRSTYAQNLIHYSQTLRGKRPSMVILDDEL